MGCSLFAQEIILLSSSQAAAAAQQLHSFLPSRAEPLVRPNWGASEMKSEEGGAWRGVAGRHDSPTGFEERAGPGL